MHDAKRLYNCRYAWNYVQAKFSIEDAFVEGVDTWDHTFLWFDFFTMTFMVVTWLKFKQKRKQTNVLVVAILMWLHTVVELLGYLIYPNRQDRYTINGWEDVPAMQGWNYCAVSGILDFGILIPTFQCMVTFIALDVWLKIVGGRKNTEGYWKFYLGVSVVVAFLGKTLPWYILNSWAGFNGINRCDLNQDVWPHGRTTQEALLTKDFLEHLNYVCSMILFIWIIIAVTKSLKRVNAVGGDKKNDSMFQTLKLVKTPLIFVLTNSLVMSGTIVVEDFYSSVMMLGDRLEAEWKWENCIYFSSFNSVDQDAKVYAPDCGTYDMPMPALQVIKILMKWIINHSGPITLFSVFCVTKDVKKLWFDKFGWKVTGRPVSSYDWTIVKHNLKLTSIARYLPLSIFPSDSENKKWGSEIEIRTSNWESTASVAETGGGCDQGLQSA